MAKARVPGFNSSATTEIFSYFAFVSLERFDLLLNI